MKWTNINIKSPESTGKYNISITTNSPYGQYTFTYLAHFDFEERVWYKYDPFESKIGDQITDKINGWIEDMVIYSG